MKSRGEVRLPGERRHKNRMDTGPRNINEELKKIQVTYTFKTVKEMIPLISTLLFKFIKIENNLYTAIKLILKLSTIDRLQHL